MLFGKQYCGFTRLNLRTACESLSGLALQDVSADYPGTVCEGMIGGDFAAIDGQSQRTRADIEICGGIGQVDPGRLFIGLIAGDTNGCAMRLLSRVSSGCRVL